MRIGRIINKTLPCDLTVARVKNHTSNISKTTRAMNMVQMTMDSSELLLPKGLSYISMFNLKLCSLGI